MKTMYGRTLRWRDGDDHELLDAATEADVVAAMRRRSGYGNVSSDLAYMHAVAKRFHELDGVTVRVDSVANFVADLVAVGHVEAVWMEAGDQTTRISPDSYRLARLCLCSNPGPVVPMERRGGMDNSQMSSVAPGGF